MDDHPLIGLVQRLMDRTDLSQAEADRLVREAWDAGVAEGERRQAADLAAAHREVAELRSGSKG
jgi:hypothetical protein